MEPVERHRPSDVALRYRYCDDGVEVGAIASITQPFCAACTRARLSSDGRLYTCLFASSGTDLKTPLRSGASDGELQALLHRRWMERDDRYSELRAARMRRGAAIDEPRVEMFRIGG